MKQFFLTMLGVFAGLVVFFVILPVVGLLLLVGAAASSSKPVTPAHTVLELDLRRGLTDQAPTNPFAMLDSSQSVLGVIDTLAQAESDSNVKALLIRAPEGGMTPAYADEIRQAVQRFRKSGKLVVAHSQGFAPSGVVMSSYMLASSADELWMQNTSSFQATGVSMDSMFLGRAADKYGVKAEFEQRYEYKNAVNEFTQSDFTPAHREAMTAWMNSIYTSVLSVVATDRKQDPVALKAVIEAGPYTPEQALQLKLIDKIGQVEEAEAYVKEKAGKDAKIVSL
ncbi:S49 family peptidase, partial [Brevundimonas sp.]